MLLEQISAASEAQNERATRLYTIHYITVRAAAGETFTDIRTACHTV